ncbi:MAG: gliding motility-associated C-terminal domain-containing protein [Candidatus Pedobacter colombiensis]|uniref:Gliding motility-associated C-terminal domain-containing protein n=1 Tax=Candidatus Pedobacter colombiensis TaxID=3121371 RepID=A0AAJ6B7S0_9SPHI|nr:PKD-like domain-containing protein [Pedobacter sp.]WEK18363.1 MAG: gliding motility-associated C-terminal domain-containing protein [Pedobacter sp.]
MSIILRWLPLFLFIFLFNTSGSAQTTNTIDVDLTASPNITKTYNGYRRSGTDCGGSSCIVFNITLNPATDLVSFSSSKLASAFYTIDCGPQIPIGTPACISGKTQVRLSFCKNGNDVIDYTITASTAVSTSGDMTVRTGCSMPLSVIGIDPSSTVWTSVYPGAPGAYNSFLSCQSGCATTAFTAGSTAPPYIDYKVSGTVSTCPNQRSAIVRVYVVPGMQVSFNPGNTVICSGTATTLSTSVTGGNPPYNYSWTRDGAPLPNTTSSISATNVGTYVVTVSDNTNCASIPQSIVVSAAATPAAPTATSSTICSGSSAILSATAPGGTYQWYDAATNGNLLSNNANYTTPTLTSNKTYYVQTIMNGCTSQRTAVTVQVNPIPPAPTATGITICSGNAGVLTATAPGGNYEWYNAPSGGTLLGSNSTFTTPALTTTTTYYVQTTVNGCTSARTAITVTVNPTPVAPTASNAIICNGTSTTLTATAPGGNYEWFDVASGGIPLISSSTFTTPALTATTIYYVQTTVNGCPSARTPVTVTVNAIPVPPSVLGAAICSGTSTTLTATAPGGTYQWYSASIGGTFLGTGPTYTTPTLTGSTTYYVQTTVNGCTSTRTAVNVVVNPIPAAPTATGITICSGNAGVLTATAPGGNYEWYTAISGGTLLSSNDTFTTPALLATTTYYVQTTVNGCISPRNPVTVTVNPTPVAPTAINPTICSGTSTTLTATPPGGNYKWYDAPVAGSLLASNANYTTPILTTTTTYYVETTINNCTSARTAVTVTVPPLPAAPTVSEATICSGKATTLTATAPGGLYRWYTMAGVLLTSTPSYTTPVLTATTTYRVQAISPEGCPGPYTSVRVTVTPEEDAGFHYASGTFCKTGSNPTPTVVNPAGGTFSSAPAGLTMDSSTGKINLSTSAAGTYTITFSTNTTCIYTSSSEITITEAPDASFTYTSPYCQNQTGQALPDFPVGSSAGIFSSTAGLVFSNPTTGEIDLQLSTPGTYLITNTIAPFGSCPAASASFSLTINPTPKVTSPAAATICNNTAQNYIITSDVDGTAFTWGRTAVAGIDNLATTAQSRNIITETLVNSTAAPINVVYEIIPSLNGCNGPKFTYTLTVNPTPTVTSPASATICNNTAQDYQITGNVSGSTYTWSRAVVPGIDNPLVTAQTGDNITETLVNTTPAPVEVIYEITPSANGCTGPVFTYKVTVIPTAEITSAPMAEICNNTTQNYTITSNVSESTFTWSRAAVAGINNPAVVAQTSNSITEALVNNTSAPIDVLYKISASLNGCDEPVFTYKLTVNPTPIVTSASDAIICNNIAQNYPITSNVSNSTFKWSRAAVTGISNLAVTAQNSSTITETLENTTSAPIEVVYEILPIANQCDGPLFTYRVTVNPTPRVTSEPSSTSCNSSPQNYTISGDVNGTTFIWSRATVAGISNIAVNNQTGSISETLTNTTNAPVDVKYTIYPSANGCNGPAFTYTVTVNPTPKVTSPAAATICNNTAQNYIITSDVDGTAFTWGRTAVAGIDNLATTAQSGNIITETLVNSTAAPINVVYEIIPSLNGCNGPKFTYTLTVNPTPTVTSPASATICNNTAQDYQITGNVSGSTYTWSRAVVPGIDNPLVTAQTGDNITETLVNTTPAPVEVIYEITPSANGCTGPVFTYKVTVIPTAEITSAPMAEICNNTTQNYTITSNVSESTFTWSRAAVAGINNPAVVAQASNSITEALVNNTSAPIDVLYKISASLNGCDGPVFTYKLTVNPTPIVTSASDAIICNNIAQNYPITSNVSNSTFKWSRAAVTGISNLAVTAQNSSTITETLENTTSAPIEVVYEILPTANQCDGPLFTYRVTVNPTPRVTNEATSTICNNTLQNYTITGDVNGTAFTWSRAAVAGISNTAVNDQNDNTITESLMNTTSAPIVVIYEIIPSFDGCNGPMFTYEVTVNPTPIVSSAASTDICNNTAQNYTITSDVSGTTFTWSRAAVTGISNIAVNAQTGDNITEILVNTTSAPINVVYEITPSLNGCNGPMFTYTLTVNPTPTITSPISTTICNNTAQNYTITSDVSGTTFTWSRATVTGISNAAVNAQTGDNITETLVNTTSAPINVVYEITPSANGCNGPMFTYTLTVNPTPTVTSPATANICNNTAQNYTITSDVSGTTFTWSRAAVAGIDNLAAVPQSGNSITETLLNSTAAPINVVYEIIPSLNGCNGPIFTYTLTVNPTPTITSDPSITLCNNTAQNYTITSDVSGTTFTWSRATITGISNTAVNTQNGNSITETLMNTTSAPIVVTYEIIPSANNCSGPTFIYTVTVNPTPTVTSAASADICNNTAQNYTITSDVNGTTFIWSRATVTGISNTAVNAQNGDMITETLMNTTSAPINVVYEITPSANGCSGPIFTYTLTVNPTSTVTSATSANICNNTAQNYTITSDVSGTTFTWSRPTVTGISNTAVNAQNGSTITETLVNTTSAPIVVVYEITPSANGCNGPMFTYTLTVNPTPTVTSPATANICNNTAQNYQITGSVNGGTYTWSRAAVIGIDNPLANAQTTDNITETLVNTTSVPIVVTYEITPSANGCNGPMFTYTLTVNPTPTVTSPATANICNNTAQNYTITSDVSGTTFTWSRAAIIGIDNPMITAQLGNSITETLMNTTSAPISVVYEITPSLNGCNGPMVTYTLTVNPTPNVTSLTSATICNNTAQNYQITGSVNGSTYTWSRAVVPGIDNTLVTAQTGDNITETLVNTTSAPINVVYEITPSANGCSGPTFNYTVTVNPTPTVTSPSTANICNNTAQNYTIASDVSETTFTWSRATVTGISNTAVNAQNSNIITETLMNTTSAPINVVYEITPSANGCNGPMFTYTLAVNPTPTVTSPATANICNNTTQNYTITSDVSGTTFTWSRATVTGISNTAVNAQNGSTITETLVNTTSTPINVVYEITPSANGCNGPMFTYTLTVNPTPTVTSLASSTICNNTAQNYTITSDVSGTTFTWSRATVTGISNTAVNAQNGSTITETLVNTTSAPIVVAYEITPSANGCNGPMFTYTLTVNPTPTVTSPATANICNNTAQNYTITSDASGATFTWSRAAITGISNPMITAKLGNSITETLVNSTAASINVVYEIIPSLNGCNGPMFTYMLTVNPTPTVISPASTAICNNTAQNYTITSDVSGTTFTWSRATITGISNTAVNAQNSNTITETLMNTTSAPIVVTYEIIPAANGCSGTTFNYTVTVNPTPTVTSAAIANICNNTAQNYTITSDVSGTTFTWSRATVIGISNTAVNAQNGNTITETLVNTTSAPIVVAYEITPSANGCNGPMFTYTLTVNPTPTVTSPATANICNNTAQNYTISSDASGATFTWSRAAITGISNTAVNAQNGSTITETLVNTTNLPINVIYNIVPSINGCSGPSFTYTVKVNPTPTVTSPATANICNNTTQNYTITSNVANVTFTWSRAAVAGISNLTVSDQTESPITEALINTTLVPISVTYKIIPSAYGCNGEAFTYTLVVYPTSNITSATTSTICNNTAQNYLITSNVSGMTYTWSRATVVGINNAAVIAQNGNAITESLVNTTDLPILVSYDITPTINGCNGPIFRYTVTVNPTSRVINTPLSQTICSTSSSSAVLLQSNVTGTTFTWTATASTGITGFLASGTGDIPAQTLYNSLPSNGTITYTIKPSFAGCNGVAVNYVMTVLNQVPVTPLVTNNSPICVGNSLILSAQNVNGATYAWTGPDGFTSNLQNPIINNVTLNNEGVYSVKITVGQCSAPATTTVIVNKPAIVTSKNDQTVCANNSVIEIYGTVSGGSTTGIWTTSGSGIFPSGVNSLTGTYVPSDADKAAGDVVLTLTATNTNSCIPATSSFHLTITPVPIVSAGGNKAICRYERLVLRGQSTSPAVKWTSTGTGIFLPNNSSLNVTYVPSNNDKTIGSVDITLSSAENSNCILVSDKINVKIIPPPTVELGPDVYVFQGESKVLDPLNVTGDNLKYLWTPNIGLNDNTLKSPLFTGTKDTKYTLTVTGTTGCIAVDEFFVKVLKPIQIPNAFSPNGDGINDTWSIKNIDNYRGAIIKVFNRYGTKLFEANARDLDWDGTYKGSPLPVGVYYYILDLKEYGKPISGNITIIR